MRYEAGITIVIEDRKLAFRSRTAIKAVEELQEGITLQNKLVPIGWCKCNCHVGTAEVEPHRKFVVLMIQ